MSRINKLLSDEAAITAVLQGKLKGMIISAIKTEGLDKEQIRESMAPGLTELIRPVIRGYLKLGLDWLKG